MGATRTSGRFLLARTDRLFTIPSFLSGAARALDLGATSDSYNISSSPTEADMRAIASDWGVVSNDVWEAYNRLKKPSVAAQAGD